MGCFDHRRLTWPRPSLPPRRPRSRLRDRRDYLQWCCAFALAQDQTFSVRRTISPHLWPTSAASLAIANRPLFSSGLPCLARDIFYSRRIPSFCAAAPERVNYVRVIVGYVPLSGASCLMIEREEQFDLTALPQIGSLTTALLVTMVVMVMMMRGEGGKEEGPGLKPWLSIRPVRLKTSCPYLGRTCPVQSKTSVQGHHTEA